MVQRGLVILVGWVWGGLLLVIGIWLWQNSVLLRVALEWPEESAIPLERTARVLGVFAIGWGYFVFMILVADKVCFRAPAMMCRFLRVFAGATAVGALGCAVWQLGMFFLQPHA